MPEIVLPGDMAQRVTGTHWSARLQQVTYDLGLTGTRGALLAFADYDSDNFVDLFIAAPAEEETIVDSESDADGGSLAGDGSQRTAARDRSVVGGGGDAAAGTGHDGGSAEIPPPQRRLQTWMWRGDAHNGKFELLRQWRVPGLVGLIPGDFDGNGQLDAVAITAHERCAATGALSMHLCNHTLGCAAALEATALPMDGGAMMSQPLALDLNGDMRTDLLATHAPLDAACQPGQAEARAWLNQWDGPGGFERLHPLTQRLTHNTTAAHAPWPMAPPAPPPAPKGFRWPWQPPEDDDAIQLPSTPLADIRFAVPNSNANVDLDGDCRADLVLVALPPGASSQGRAAAAASSTGAGAAGCEGVACQLLLWLQPPPPAPGEPAPAAPHASASASAADATLLRTEAVSPSSARAAGAIALGGDAEGSRASGGEDSGSASADAPDAPGHSPPFDHGDRWPREPSLNLTLPVGASQLAYADMDADGLLDIVFVAPAEGGGGGASGGGGAVLHVWYAQLVQSPSTRGAPLPEASCAPPPRGIGRAGELCAVRPDEALAFYKRAFALPHGWKVGDGGGADARAAGLPERPATLSIADFFLDGYPEVLLPLVAPLDWEMGYDGRSRFSGRGCKAGERCLALLHNDDRMRCDEGSLLKAYSSQPSSATDSLGDSNGARLYPLLSRASVGAPLADSPPMRPPMGLQVPCESLWRWAPPCGPPVVL